MDELTLSTLQRPQVQVVRAQPPAQLAPEQIQSIAANRASIDSLLAQVPTALSNSSIGGKVAVLNDLQKQLDVTTGLMQNQPEVLRQELRGRGVTNVGAQPILQDRLAPLRRNALELASVIERVKGNISTAREFSRQAAQVVTSSDEQTIQTITNTIQASGEGLSFEEAQAAAQGLDRRGTEVRQQQELEEDLINAKAEAINANPNPVFAQSILGNVPAEDVFASIEAESDIQAEEQQVQASEQANRILTQSLAQQERQLIQ